MKTAINIVAMQIAWFACVLGAAHELAWIGTATTAVVVLAHELRAAHPAVEFKLICGTVVIGFVIDSAFASSGVLAFASDVWVEGMTTHWMLALWAGFATTLTSGLAWVIARPWIAIAFGTVGGPIAYAAGARLGAISLTSTFSLVAIAVGWGAAMWLLTQLTRRLALQTSREALV